MNQEQSVIFHLSHLTKVINHRATSILHEEGCNISIEHTRFLMMLYYQGRLSQQELANVLCRDKSSVQRTVTMLVRKHLVQVDSDRSDKRKNIISLTGLGRNLTGKIEENILEIEHRLFEHLGQNARQRLINLINELIPHPWKPIAIQKTPHLDIGRPLKVKPLKIN